MTCLSALILVFLLGLLVLFKVYHKLTTRWCTSKVCLVGKTIIVTGSTTVIRTFAVVFAHFLKIVWVSVILIFSLGLLGLLFLLKVYLKLKTKWCSSKVSLTGASTGIGYETALEFAKRGARVILACNNETHAREVRDKIIGKTYNKNVVHRYIDMSSLKSVRNFAKNILETEERLDVLVNNAGIITAKEMISEDGLDPLMQVNYFGPFLLTVLLTGLLKKSAPSRIVNVSSIAAAYAKLDIDKITEYPGRLYLYSNSKLCNILFTMHLAKLLEKTNVTVYSLHPGAVDSEIFVNVHGFKRYIVYFVKKIFFKTPEEGAQTTIYTTTVQNIETYSGRHFEECHVVKTYKTATDASSPKKLWDKTVELMKLEEAVKNL